jgi:hypothetical protein
MSRAVSRTGDEYLWLPVLATRAFFCRLGVPRGSAGAGVVRLTSANLWRCREESAQAFFGFPSVLSDVSLLVSRFRQGPGHYH